MVRAGIVVTGTEVLTGRVADANGPWLAEELRGLGVDVGRIVVVGDRREDLAASLSWLAADHDLLVTTGGLGPTADDLTAEVVAQVQGRPMHRDADLAARIIAIIERLNARRGWSPSPETIAAGADKQALVPDEAVVLDPVGTAPGLVVTAAAGGPPVIVLPGPPGELRPMWDDALRAAPVRAVVEGAGVLRQRTVRIWGPPEAELAALLRDHEDAHGSLDDAGLEVTTCLREGELEVVTRHSPAADPAYDALRKALLERFGEQVYSDDAGPVDEVVARLLLDAEATIATAESCTAGMLASRLADRPGSSAYLLGGFVTYADAAKTAELGVSVDLLARVGAVSPEVAEAMATGARARLDSTYAVAVTGVAGPGGGSEEKPVGLVHVALAGPDGVRLRELRLGGSRTAIRQRTVVACLHLLREELGG